MEGLVEFRAGRFCRRGLHLPSNCPLAGLAVYPAGRAGRFLADQSPGNPDLPDEAKTIFAKNQPYAAD
jgi:hypothetical protein